MGVTTNYQLHVGIVRSLIIASEPANLSSSHHSTDSVNRLVLFWQTSFLWRWFSTTFGDYDKMIFGCCWLFLTDSKIWWIFQRVMGVPCQFIVFKIFINDKMALLTGKILMTCPTNQLEINYIFQKTAYLSKKGCTAKLSSFSSSFNVFFPNCILVWSKGWRKG